MDSRAIEMRLRLPAPDEPAVLPPLVLPAFDAYGRVSPTARFRTGTAAQANPRLALALVALALATAAVVLAGALRLLNEKPSLVNQLVWPPAEGVLGVHQDGFTMEWPDSWVRLAEGGLFQGDFTQTGISYERVAIILASTDLPGCPGGATTEGPTAVPSGDLPRPVQPSAPDPAVACLRSKPLPSNAVRVIVEVGERSRGLLAANGPAIPDWSEPTRENGWTEVIDGQPGRLTIIAGADAEAIGAFEVRTWDVIFPLSIDHVLRIRADIAGPDVSSGRAAVQTVIDSLDFTTAPQHLDRSTASSHVVGLIDDLDRSARRERSDYFACFPRSPGSADGTISAGPWERLAAPVKVTCTTSMAASVAQVWRVTLASTWAAGDGYPAGGLAHEFIVYGGGGPMGGPSVSYPLDEAGVPQLDSPTWLPQAPRILPAPADAPLDLAAGSFVELLWPGIYPVDSPGSVSSDLYPGGVGWHLYLIDGAQLVDGVEWYPVQWEEGWWQTFTKWVPATRDGRPTIAAIMPSCPFGEVDIEALSWLTAAERLACFGNRELMLGPVIAGPSYASADLCSGPEFQPTSCPNAAAIDWLEADPLLVLFGKGGSTGPVPGISIWTDPSRVGPVPSGQWLRVTGHFDDSLALDCRQWPTGETVTHEKPIRELVLQCRERFVVTSFELAEAP